MAMKAPNKEVRELLRKVQGQGCEVVRLGSGHFRISKPGNVPTVTLSGTAMSKSTWMKMTKLIRTLLSVEV